MRTANGLVLASVFILGCGGSGTSASSTSDVAANEAALDSSDVNSSEAALVTSGMPTSVSGIAGAAIAQEIAATWGSAFTPAGCATSTATGNTVTLTLAACTGPYGLVAATGTVAVDITPSSGGFDGHVTTTGLALNKSTLDIDSTFTYTSTNGTSSLSVKGGGTATGPRGHQLTREANYTVTWGSGCLSIDGTVTSTVASVDYTLTIKGYDQCKGKCPTAGGSISWTGAKRTFDIVFDGSAVAAFTLTNGTGTHAGDVDLLCTP